MKAQHEGAQTHPCIIRKNLQVPHTAGHVVCHPVHNSRGKLSSILHTGRGLTLLSQICWDPSIRIRNGEEP